MSGVSADMGPAPTPSQVDQDLRLAYEGDLATFMDRLQAMSVEKAKADTARFAAEKALAELKLGQSAQTAFAAAEKNRQAAQEKLEQAQALVVRTERECDEMRAKAKDAHDALIAEAQQLLNDASLTKDAADRELAAANARMAELQSRIDAADRRAEMAARQEEIYRYRSDAFRIAIEEFARAVTSDEMQMNIKARVEKLKQPAGLH